MYPGAFVSTTPDKPAIVMGGSGFTQTFAELDAAANRLSRLLRAVGVLPGDHVALCMENHDRYFEIVWGCHYAGAVYTACSSRLTSGELSYILNDCAAKVFITSKYKADQAAEIVGDTPGVELRLMLDGTIDGHESYETAVAAQEPTPLEGQRIAGIDMLYSSGTTGKPKGVTKPFPNEPLEGTPAGVASTLGMLFGFGQESIYLSPAPMYHAAPLRFCIGAMAIGATVIAMEHFDAEQYLQLVERHKITHSQVVPTMFVRMLKLDPDVARQVRRVVAGVRDPRCGALPDPGEEADDRVVRPDHPRVLRRHRRQRFRVLQQRHVVGSPRHGRHADRVHRAHRR